MSELVLAPHELVNQKEELFKGSLTDNNMQWTKESQFAIQQLQNNEHLYDTAVGNGASLENALINVAAIGISLNPALKHAYLVPRKVNKKAAVCLDVSYMGLIHLAVTTGSILWAQSKLVHENDEFALNGVATEPTHKYNPFADRGAITGAYCIVKTLDGDFLTETMTIKDIYNIRDRSESFKKGYGPWKSDEGEMIKKTVVKRAYKYWPKCERLATAIDELNSSGEGLAEISEDTYIQERSDALNDLAVHAAEEFIHADTCNSMDELKQILNPLARKAKQVEATGILNSIGACKRKNESRILEQSA